MAYINVAEWTPDQVTDWLKGLDDSMYNYVYSFTNNEVGGQQLLNIRPYELEELGMHSIGHQEIVLEAVEHLRNFHYNLDKENLQFLALHVATAARSLYKQLAHYCDKSKIETQILNDITRTIATIKPVINWLDRVPFQGQFQFNEIRKNMLRLGLEMATSAQRDRFVENPVDQIRMTAEKLAKLADYIIQDISDPMLLQPASLSLVTLKKRESELGFNIVPSFHGVHRISDIKYNSPAHNSGKIEDGDEIVQINYQTVVGWQYKTVILQLRESPPDVLLTLKKRPKHTKIYGQIYMQPYRLPSKKRAPPGRWGENQPSPRANFLAVQDFTLPLKINEKHTASDTDSSCSDILTPTDPKSVDKEIRLYLPKPRAVLQRRNTICGDELSYLKNVGNIPLWDEKKFRQNGEATSPSLRDKSVSFGFGLEIAPRPTTCLGIATNGKLTELMQLNSLPEINAEQEKLKSSVNGEKSNNVCRESPKPGVSKVVRFDANMKYEDYHIDNEYTCNVDNTILETFEPIPYVDDEDVPSCRETNTVSKKNDITESNKFSNSTTTADSIQAQTQTQIQPKLSISSVVNKRGRLDKSHSTPAYDNSGDDSDTPPATEPRKEMTTPPAPPPRPRRQTEIQSPVPPPPPKPISLCQSTEKPSLSSKVTSLSHSIPASVHFLQENIQIAAEESELVTPTKTKNLTLKKKNSLLAKRRKISLKALGISDIQGHLYRRTKDKRGVTFWAKLYFVLIETVLYGFRNKEAQKANCMIILPGFTVSLAKEVHSKPFAFKVYHPTKTFYFAAESVEAMNQWMDFIRQATLSEQKSTPTKTSTETDIKNLFSETDSSGDENDSSSKQLSSNLFSLANQTGNGIKDNNQRTGESSFSSSSSSKHDKYLGSLKLFSKTSLPFKSSGEKKTSSDVPVPTAQFRSYRKVPGGSYGLQIGINSTPYQNENSPPNQLQIIVDQGANRKQSVSSTQSNNEIGIGNNECKISNLNKDNQHQYIYQQKQHDWNFNNDKPKKIRRTSPYNYIHASNPNLVEFDFQTSKSLDFSLPKINSSNSWEAHSNLAGFMTLKDLMLQKQKEEAQEMYNNRVFLGVEKKYDRNLKLASRNRNRQDGETGNININGKEKLSKIQSRSLPKTPDYEMSFKPDDEDIKRTRTKEGLKLRDFGYEFIYGDEPGTNDTGSENKSNVPVSHQAQTMPKKKHSSMSCSHADTNNEKQNNSGRGGSFKKTTKGKFDAFKTSSEKLFQFKHSNSEAVSLKQTTVYSPLTLPLNKKSNHPYIQIDPSCIPQTNLKKSHTYFSDSRDKKFESLRKNSAPVPIFSKFTFSAGNNKTVKEKKLLGSPRLHRAIFGGRTTTSSVVSSSSSHNDLEHEIFSPIIFSKNSTTNQQISSDISVSQGNQCTGGGTTTIEVTLCQSVNVNPTHPTPEYPNMECPPVFEPETYSLSDPNASLTLLRRRQNLQEN